jgi:hypothetical protein
VRRSTTPSSETEILFIAKPPVGHVQSFPALNKACSAALVLRRQPELGMNPPVLRPPGRRCNERAILKMRQTLHVKDHSAKNCRRSTHIGHVVDDLAHDDCSDLRPNPVDAGNRIDLATDKVASVALFIERCCRWFVGGVAQFLLCGVAKSSHELNRIRTTHQIAQPALALLFLTLAYFLRG